jgi:hypothetical protein
LSEKQERSGGSSKREVRMRATLPKLASAAFLHTLPSEKKLKKGTGPAQYLRGSGEGERKRTWLVLLAEKRHGLIRQMVWRSEQDRVPC